MLLKAVFNGVELGSISDCVSASCNVAMAGSAVYAAMQAKKWFESKKYELAHSASRDLIFTLSKMRPLLTNLSSHIEVFSASSSAKKDIGEIISLTKNIYPHIENLETYLFDLERLGWKIKNCFSDIHLIPNVFDVDVITSQIEMSLVLFIDSPEFNSRELEFDVKSLSEAVKECDSIVDKFLLENLEYTEYFDISPK